MQTYEVAKGIDLDFGATASGAAIDMSEQPFPFQPGGNAIAVLSVQSWTEAELVGASLKLQGSDNAFSGWEDLATVGALASSPLVMVDITIPAFLRWHNGSLTAGDGRGSISLIQN